MTKMLYTKAKNPVVTLGRERETSPLRTNKSFLARFFSKKWLLSLPGSGNFCRASLRWPVVFKRIFRKQILACFLLKPV
jgi:hypothetical protein